MGVVESPRGSAVGAKVAQQTKEVPTSPTSTTARSDSFAGSTSSYSWSASNVSMPDIEKGQHNVDRGHSSAGPGPRSRKGILLSKLVNRIGMGIGCALCFLGWKFNKIQPDGEFVWGIVAGGLVGLHLVRKYRHNRRRKIWISRKLLESLVEGGLLEYENSDDKKKHAQAEEGVDFLNAILNKLWPYYESAVCGVILNAINPMLQQLKPPFVKNIYFRTVYFGDSPLSFTQVKVLEKDTKKFTIEAEVRWEGCGINGLVVELKGGRVVHPRICKLEFWTSAVITFTPLVPYFPGFGAISITLRKQPFVRFELAMGEGVLKLLQDQIRNFLHSFLVDHIFGRLLVWPNRVVVPILPEHQRGNIDHLYLHTRGVLKVEVKEAEGLGDAQGHNGFKSNVHPFVVLETVPLQPVATKVLPNKHRPVWNEEHYLRVQELEQCLRITVMDDHYDPGIVPSISYQRKGRKLGVHTLPLSMLSPGVTIDDWFELGGSFQEEGIVGPIRSKHHGPDILSEMWYVPSSKSTGVGSRIRLALTFLPVDWLRQGRLKLASPSPRSLSGRHIHHGLLFMRLLGAYNLGSVGSAQANPYCLLRLGNKEVKRSRVIKECLNPKWNESFEWFNVSIKDWMAIEVFDEKFIMDARLGYVKIPIKAIAKESEKRPDASIEATLELEGGLGDIHLMFDWVPLDGIPVGKVRSREVGKKGILNRVFSVQRGPLIVRLCWAKHLDNVDFLGLSNPFCVLKIQGNERRSQVIRNCLDPTWMEIFSWESVKSTDLLDVMIYDKGALRNTLLGRCIVRVEEAAKTPGAVHQLTKMLSNEKLNVPGGGTVTLQLLWEGNLPHYSGQSKKDTKQLVWPDPQQW